MASKSRGWCSKPTREHEHPKALDSDDEDFRQCLLAFPHSQTCVAVDSAFLKQEELKPEEDEEDKVPMCKSR